MRFSLTTKDVRHLRPGDKLIVVNTEGTFYEPLAKGTIVTVAERFDRAFYNDFIYVNIPGQETDIRNGSNWYYWRFAKYDDTWWDIWGAG